jgi:hypothetical protein
MTIISQSETDPVPPGQRRRSRARRCRRGRILLTDRPLRAMPIVSIVFGGSVIPAALTDGPLPAVRIDVTTPVRPADGRGVHVDRGDRHGAERQRQDDDLPMSTAAMRASCRICRRPRTRSQTIRGRGPRAGCCISRSKAIPWRYADTQRR